MTTDHDYEAALDNWRDVIKRLPHLKNSILLGTLLSIDDALETMSRMNRDNLVMVPRRDTFDDINIIKKIARKIGIAGNHLGCVIPIDHLYFTATTEEALNKYGAGNIYDTWVAWKLIYESCNEITEVIERNILTAYENEETNDKR